MGDVDGAAWGAWLKGLRTRANLTQADVAAALMVDRSRVIGWEKGRNIPNGRHLLAIFQACHVKLDESVPQPPEEPKPTLTLAERVEELTETVIQLRDELRSLTEAQQDPQQEEPPAPPEAQELP